MHLYLHLAHASMSYLVALLADSLFDCNYGSVLLFCATFSMGLGLVYGSSVLAIHNSTGKKCRSDPGSLKEIPNYVYIPACAHSTTTQQAFPQTAYQKTT